LKAIENTPIEKLPERFKAYKAGGLSAKDILTRESAHLLEKPILKGQMKLPL
jgi:hypothetical protein